MSSLDLERDLGKIALRAAEREEENRAFRSFLQGREAAEVDERVQRLNGEISARIDCTRCGNCCKTFMISLEETDIARASAQAGEPTAVFKERYLEKSSGGQYIFNRIPCHFLEGNKCTIYEGRPDDCRSFPHLDRPGFTGRLLSVLYNYGVCPIVYNVLEALKEELDF